MKVSLKHLYRYFKKILGLKNDHLSDDNPYVIF